MPVLIDLSTDEGGRVDREVAHSGPYGVDNRVRSDPTTTTSDNEARYVSNPGPQELECPTRFAAVTGRIGPTGPRGGSFFCTSRASGLEWGARGSWLGADEPNRLQSSSSPARGVSAKDTP